MQKRAGLLFLAKNTKKILLILEGQRWTVPTFSRHNSLLEDAKELLDTYSQGRILPIELYLSEDNGFEYGTYVCLVEKEFMSKLDHSYSWCKLNDLPKHLHSGLSTTLNNKIINAKIETILELNL